MTKVSSSKSDQINPTRHLSSQHLAHLSASGIANDVIAERGYFSVDSREDLKRFGFSRQDIESGLVIRGHKINGDTFNVLRPDSPPLGHNGKPQKYLMTSGHKMALDVHPRVRSVLDDPSIPLVITEGQKKADAALSIGLMTICLHGVYGWRGTNSKGGKTVLADFEEIAFNGRRIYLAFDSDFRTNESVLKALKRFGAFMEGRGAIVQFLILPEGPNETKQGLDDYIAQGHSDEDVLSLATDDLDSAVARAKIEQTLEGNSGFELTDLGNARRLQAGFGCDYRWEPATKTLYSWDEVRWIPDQWALLEDCAIKVVRLIQQEAVVAKSSDRGSQVEKWATQSQSRERLSAMKDLARTLPGQVVRPVELDAQPDLFNTLSGPCNLKSVQLQKPDRSNLLTNVSGSHCETNAICSRWEQFTSEVMCGDQEMIKFLQRLCGYILLSGNPERIISILWGSGKNGKTIFLNILRYVFGSYARVARIETLTTRRKAGQPTNDLDDLRGARLVTMSESGATGRINEALMKEISGGDAITARGMYQSNRTWYPEFTLMVATNHLPVIRDSSFGSWDRMILIPWLARFDGTADDIHLGGKLRAEADGIFQWCLRGLQDYYEVGLAPPHSVIAANEQFRAESDPFLEWFGECVTDVRESDPRLFTTTASLYESYKRIAESSGDARPELKNALGSYLAARGFKPGRTNSVRGYLGIRLMTDRL
ncbi:MAG: DUF3854 domain-containing protein [Chloroflexi bacterium]|nr:DUF3854 domain-containing protein [Chloroflexota bacterium]